MRRNPINSKPKEGHTYLKLDVVLRLEFKIRPVEDTRRNGKADRMVR